jgi:hypothetical protein
MEPLLKKLGAQWVWCHSKIDIAYPLNFAGADIWISIAQIFKQFQLKRLIKEGKVIILSRLVEAKAQPIQRVGNFQLA